MNRKKLMNKKENQVSCQRVAKIKKLIFRLIKNKRLYMGSKIWKMGLLMKLSYREKLMINNSLYKRAQLVLRSKMSNLFYLVVYPRDFGY